MKVLVASTWVWWCMIMIGVALPSLATTDRESLRNKLGYSMVTLDLRYGSGTYPNFLTKLRNTVQGPNRPCNIPSTRSSAILGQEYVLVKLQISNTEWVTLGIDVKDLYLWGYEDNVKYDGKYRATFLKDATQAAENSLFPGSTKRKTRFGSNYRELEQAAGVSRESLVLGIPNLIAAIRNVYNKTVNTLDSGRDEAKFFLLAIQMVPEAARFKFMEQPIMNGVRTAGFKTKMLAFQNDWATISTAIFKAEGEIRKCTTFSPPLKVGTTNYQNVDDIKNDMGILKYTSTKLSILSSILADDANLESLM